MQTTLRGLIVDVRAGKAYPGEIVIRGRRIIGKRRLPHQVKCVITPGYVMAHGHPESSCMTTAQAQWLYFRDGTTSLVVDIHELVNVCGAAGVDYFLELAAKGLIKLSFGLPSSVPASKFEVPGTAFGYGEIKRYIRRKRVYGLGELMDFYGLIAGAPEPTAKCRLALDAGKIVDGHLPDGCVTPEEARRYFAAGPSTNHEFSSLDPALAALIQGALVQARRGDAADDLPVLKQLFLMGLPLRLRKRLALCNDDLSPHTLAHKGALNPMIRELLDSGADVVDVFRAASLNPIRHYNLPAGALGVGDAADVVVHDLDYRVMRTYVDGRLVADRQASGEFGSFPYKRPPLVNNWHRSMICSEALRIAPATKRIRIIGVKELSLVTASRTARARVQNGAVVSDPANDVYQIAVIDRYHNQPPVNAFVQGFGFRSNYEFAYGCSIGHDCHPITVVGNSSTAMARAANVIIETHGGIVIVIGNRTEVLPLPIGGLMSPEHPLEIARQYKRIIDLAQDELHCPFQDPLMTLSFLPLSVIPELKLSPTGLVAFENGGCRLVSLFV